MTALRWIWRHGASVGRQRPVEEHGLDAVVVVEVLDVAEVGARAAATGAWRLGAQCPEICDVMGLGQVRRPAARRCSHHTGSRRPAGSRRPRLRACGRSSRACSRTRRRPRRPRSPPGPDGSPARSSEETGSSNQVTPQSSAMVRPKRMACLARIATVGIDIELDVADHLPGESDPGEVPLGFVAPGLADLDLDPGMSHSSTQLSSCLGVVSSS